MCCFTSLNVGVACYTVYANWHTHFVSWLTSPHLRMKPSLTLENATLLCIQGILWVPLKEYRPQCKGVVCFFISPVTKSSFSCCGCLTYIAHTQ